MKLPEEMTDEELEQALSGVTNEDLKNDAPLPSSQSTDDTTPSEGDDVTAKASETDPAEDLLPKTESKTSGVAKILSERNEWKKKYEQLAAERESAKGDEEMEDYDRDEKIIDTTSRIAYASEKLSDLDSQLENNFYQENPKAESHRSGIQAVMAEYPQLSIDKARSLYASQTDPLLLLDDQQINKIKGTDLSIKGSSNKIDTGKVKTATEMSDKELEDAADKEIRAMR